MIKKGGDSNRRVFRQQSFKCRQDNLPNKSALPPHSPQTSFPSKFTNANLKRAGNPVISFKLRLHPPAALLHPLKPHFPQVCECKLAAGGESRYIFQIPSSSARRSPPVPKTSFFLSLRMQTCSGRGIPLYLLNSVFIRPPRSIKLPRYCLSCCRRMNI